MARRARGAQSNPQSRFETLRHDPSLGNEPPPGLDPGDAVEADPRTLLIPDPSRSIVARNTSPDVGFAASVNPYRGCEHACIYCLAPETLVLTADLGARPIGALQAGDSLIGFDEEGASPARFRKLRTSTVLAVWRSKKPVFRIVTAGGEVIATAEHRWLDGGAFRWWRTDELASRTRLRRVPLANEEPDDDDYRAGYLTGVGLAGGTLGAGSGARRIEPGCAPAHWRKIAVDPEPLERTIAYLAAFGLELPFRSSEARERLQKILASELDSRGYRRGLLAAFVDVSGASGTSLRLAGVDEAALDRVLRASAALGFRFEAEPRRQGPPTLRLAGTWAERIRFLSTVRPAARRKLAALGSLMHLAPERVVRVEPAGEREVVDIQTSTGTFFAAGLATHNCYARPSHEYLGWSPGLDFETKILVKREAPALLRKALDSPAWKPQTIALSGVTDAYQPAERKLGLTRAVLAVLAEYRNPVAVITKSFTVTRDVDLLSELASHGAASVAISITSLDASLQRILEPRAAPPRLRLAAIEKLAEAGVPVGVMVAPIIPGLTDHEAPKILEAAAAAGAGHAGRVLLRLPHGVKELFAEWLERHFPDRKEKVLNRLRAAHGGKLYDSSWSHRQRGEGFFADQVGVLFDAARRRAGLATRGPELSAAAFRRPGAAQQPGLFD
jgi:DNA repair photolyase